MTTEASEVAPHTLLIVGDGEVTARWRPPLKRSRAL